MWRATATAKRVSVTLTTHTHTRMHYLRARLQYLTPCRRALAQSTLSRMRARVLPDSCAMLCIKVCMRLCVCVCVCVFVCVCTYRFLRSRLCAIVRPSNRQAYPPSRAKLHSESHRA